MVEMLNKLSDAGTGDGGNGGRGSRKTKAFIWMVLGVAFTMFVGGRIGVAESVVNHAMSIVGYGGLFVIGGQSLVDVFGRIAEAYATGKVGKFKEEAVPPKGTGQ